MKLYIANGTYVGTQAEAKKLDKGFEPVEVPTDKEGLIAYLNEHTPPQTDIGQLVDDGEKMLLAMEERRKHADRPAEGSLGGAERILGRMDRQAAENALRAAQDAITHGLSLLKRKHSDPYNYSHAEMAHMAGDGPDADNPLLD